CSGRTPHFGRFARHAWGMVTASCKEEVKPEASEEGAGGLAKDCESEGTRGMLGIALPTAGAPLHDASAQMLLEFGTDPRPGAAVEERDAVVGGFEEREVKVAPHLFPLGAAVRERLDGAGGDPLEVVDAVQEALPILATQPDEQVEVAALRPVAA